tara:strand:+ start:828 stop:1406 length:579 start_codon:yes stop_codon:yes gene_type:complete
MKDKVAVFLTIALVFIASTYVIMMSVGYKNDINNLEKTNQKIILANDSLKCVIDSLNTELKKFDIKYQYDEIKKDIKDIIDAIIFVESSDNDSAYRESEDAVGCLQIRQTMVNDINRILKRKGSNLRYTYNCRWDRTKSIEMFNIFIDHYNLTTAEEMARCWNGGPRGINNPYTLGYWNKVENELEESYASR